MPSPYSTGGGGTFLESKVVAAALTSVLCEAPFRGLPGLYAIEVRTQRASFGEPLDDLAVTGVGPQGASTKLHLQVKTKLTFTEADSEWADVLARAWDTFSAAEFEPSLHRLGVGIGAYTARVDQHYQAVLAWAAQSVDGEHFFERIQKDDFSHKDRATFVATLTKLLTAHAGRPLGRDQLWRFLKAFVIVHFDFHAERASRDESNVVDRIAGFLPPSDRQKARHIWDHLVSVSARMIPAGGGASRATLIEDLKGDGLPAGVATSSWRDVETINQESLRTLGDIRADIVGLRLHRESAYKNIRRALDESRFVQIIGAPGTGKSAILKQIAEESARLGPVFVLKDGRIHSRGWSAHAHTLNLNTDIRALLAEFAGAGLPILFIDGIDKISDPAVQLTVNDVLRAIVSDESLSDWSVLVTVREQNLRHLETWLDQSVLKKLPLQSVTIGPLTRRELIVVAAEIPRLKPLLLQPSHIDVVLSRPFFLDAMARLAGSTTQQLPATEVELLRLWWSLGASDRSDFSPAQHRRNALIALADCLALSPNNPIPIKELQPEPIEELKSAGVLHDDELGHSVVFSHDIYEEWALCELLIGHKGHIASYLQRVGEPQALVRPVQLLGAYALETDSSADNWRTLFNETGNEALRPVWQRAVLTSCFQSTRTTELLTKLTPELLKDDGDVLRRLLVAIATIEVIPNTLLLDESRVPDIEPTMRARLAHKMAVPKLIIWLRFLDWLVPHVNDLPAELVPDLIPVFAAWQSAFSGQNVRHCRAIGTFGYQWLLELENAIYPESWRNRRDPFGLGRRRRDEQEIESSLRSLFLSSAGDVPGLAAEYLRDKATEKRRRRAFMGSIVQNSGALVSHLPTELVDFILTAFLERPGDHRDSWGSYDQHLVQNLGIAGHQQFYPASPAQMPFLGLLRQHEEQGLRLIRGLCNHSISIWRWAHRKQRGYASLTPMALRLKLPWGRQIFWGDDYVYLWFRGFWGNDAVRSGLMALEQWAFESIDQGAEFDDIFRKAIEGINSVAALGLGVSLCIAYPEKSLHAALSLVTCPSIWIWDIARCVQDRPGLPPNELGDWYRHKFQLTAVRALNRKPHRQQDIRALTLQYAISSDKTLRRKYLRGLRSFPKRLPFRFEEEKANRRHAAELRKKMMLFAEQGDPRNLRTAPSPDGKAIQVWIEAPSLRKPTYRAQQKEHTQLNELAGLALWAVKSLEDGQLNENLSVSRAIAKGKEFDNESLFEGILGPDNLLESQRQAAVVGAAFVVARYCDEKVWNHEIAEWCLDVFRRAASAPEQSDKLANRGAILSIHPVTFAAHGYSALLARGYEQRKCKTAILDLAVDALDGVVGAVFTSSSYYAAQHLIFYSIVIDLGLRSCLVPRDAIPEFYSVAWDPRERDQKLALLEGAQGLLDTDTRPTFPEIPMPWIRSSGTLADEEERRGYVRNDQEFMFNIAEKILFQKPTSTILSDADLRHQFLRLVDQLIDWTVQQIVPPFSDSSRHHHGNPPFEWIFAFSSWLGDICAELTAAEIHPLLRRVLVQDNETALLLLQSHMRSFVIDAFLTRQDISEDHLIVWNELADWLFTNREWRYGTTTDHLDNEFYNCAVCLLFCVSGEFSPTVCGVTPGWSHWRKFLPVIERAVREFGLNRQLYFAVTVFFNGGGFDLLPDPALGWLRDVVLARKRDQAFWDLNGDGTVEFIRTLVEKKSSVLSPAHRQMITLITDILVDNGVRGAGFLQQELLRED